MADATFCTLKDLEGYEPNILDLAGKSGNVNAELAAARKEIEDRLITRLVISNLEKLGPTVKPRQLRTPAIFKTLEILFRTNTLDDESPYAQKKRDYADRFDSAFGQITVLDLDNDKDGTISEGEENTRLTNYTTLTRT